MVELLLCKNAEEKKAGIGKVFKLDIPEKNVAEFLGTKGYPQETIDGRTLYGFRVYLQKDIAEDKDGRHFDKLETHLQTMGISYEMVDWVKGAGKSEKDVLAKNLGVSPDDLTDEDMEAAREFMKARKSSQ